LEVFIPEAARRRKETKGHMKERLAELAKISYKVS